MDLGGFIPCDKDDVDSISLECGRAADMAASGKMNGIYNASISISC